MRKARGMGEKTVKGEHLLLALPSAAVLAGMIFAAGARRPRSRWVALAWLLASLPTLAALLYRAWDRHVGPGPFACWRFGLSPDNISLLLSLAGLSPLLMLEAEARKEHGWRDGLASALSCLALASAMGAILCDHLFLLALFCGLATLCAAGCTALVGERRRPRAASLLPLAMADFCLAVGIIFLYLSEPGRGLYFPALPLAAGGGIAAACALMLAAALLRLGCLPFQRWMAGIAEGGREPALIHVLAVDLTLGTYLLYLVTRAFFRWQGAWAWICFGVALATLAVVVRELLSARSGSRTWGLLAAALGAHLALAASPGSQAAGAASRLGLWAGVVALALLLLGSEGGKARSWAGVLGAASILGLPPLAGFAARWMEFQALAGGFAEGAGALYAAAIPLSFAAAMVEGFAALRMAGWEDGDARFPAALPAGMALAGFGFAVGIYPGKWVDIAMREYGLPLGLPFPTWSTLGWAMLVCAGVAVAFLAALGAHRRAPGKICNVLPGDSVAWMREIRWLGVDFSGSEAYTRALTAGGALLCAGWFAALIYLATR